ncbi:DUF5696 domain-containing protein [Paenibacillus tarimensis]
MTLWKYKKYAISLLILILLVITASRLEYRFRSDVVADIPETADSGGTGGEEVTLPLESQFQTVAETDVLILKLDENSGHFIVTDKRSGNVWRSYPDPEDWDNETVGGLWKKHLVSPLMFQYIDFTVYNSPPKDSNFVASGGAVKEVKRIGGGVQLTYDMPALGFTVPVQIRIEDDFVETKIIDTGIEEGRYSLLWLRLFPFLSAEHSKDREGYLLVPDGSGALIPFDPGRLNSNRVYQETIYGNDQSFASQFSPRYPAVMPVFGMKTGNKAFLAVMEEGEEYGSVFASPSGALSQYNWVTAQQVYRSTFFQVTNRNKGTGYTTYNKEARFGTDRTVRYYFLSGGQADYVGMASRYRQYLMDEKGMKKLTDAGEHIPMFVSFLGGAARDGILTDRYIQATTTEQAGQMVSELRGLGVGRMSVTYLGWQEGGYSSYGGYLDTDKRLGGNEGLKQFVSLAHSHDIPVYLGVNYGINNTGVHGFKERYHAIRDMAGTVQESFYRLTGGRHPKVSKKFMVDALRKDMPAYTGLNADGLFLQGTGNRVTSDYNSAYGSTRTGSKLLQQELFSEVKETVGSVYAEQPGFYLAGELTHISKLPDDYSYDLFSERAVPFAQIALHGLVTYTSGEENERDQYTNDFLRDIEYGAYPSYIFTYAESEALKAAHGLQLKNPLFRDWKETAAGEYKRYNEALAEVQDQFIVGHRELSEGVRETVYENGMAIVVNYNSTPYIYEGIEVPPRDFAVRKGADH